MTQPYYETMYILTPDIPEEEVEAHVSKYRDLVTEAGAEVLDTQMRGKRRLAYPIAKHREGIYVQLNHNGDGQQVATLERAMRLSEDVIRYLTVKQDGPMPPPRVLPSQTETTSAAEPVTETEAD
jgi:small subunit ribosomal protein S6